MVELLVTLVIMGILVGVVFPGFQSMMARNGLATSANGVVLAISYARSEAVREGGGTTLVARIVAGTQDWSLGYDVNDADGNLLRKFDPPASDLTLTSAGGVMSMTFTSQGALASGTARSLDLCLAGVSGVRISVAPTGRPDTDSLTATDCP